ncbi:efflux RND transporter permease subunit [Leptospira licerasiae]|uniref:RND transporter, Hydrophobe/Amphiphile Efflux-1 (HAE1)/Heavy Metal Efflux (HME) family, permease domain protein n=1 Tax=Leptospira licerasiae str. MMD4847 TaxID=1049971 RepID=A0ABP2RJR2_9LEPT|nr:efflux RND transporter permease subunit [Leptospira licerasiae]EIE03196.1 RND transporter, Hydrophobe/Amphiphile Efflux-1 (HAE1)/Heavy Metal Efflux (HME) family, permease domain protein [Leptospira licerasiae serovar Varillal str. VAR 010]EJZ42803.1 RND transporter, Hydrophobe/Amphiphile Efflux-1 (HAE1)/Heavy Metal Efflux (HME) family, permease domain protein [Leptospira licerasiae str. MMD4847]
MPFKFKQIFKNKPGAALSAFSIILLLSILRIFNVTLQTFPDLKSPTVTVTTSWPGTDVSKIEREITFPLEESISSLGGVSKIRSVTESGKSLITVSFATESNLAVKIAELREKIEIVSVRFPRDVRRPSIQSFDSAESPVFIATVANTDEQDLFETRRLIEQKVKPYMEGIPGIGRVLVIGGEDKEILISCDRDRLEAEGLTIGDVLNVVRQGSLYSRIGIEKGGNVEVPIFLDSRKYTPTDFASLPISFRGQGTLFLRDVAKVGYANKDLETIFRRNGKAGVSIYAFASGGLTFSSRIILNAVRDLEMEGIELRILYDKNDQIQEEMLLRFLFTCTIFIIYLAINDFKKAYTRTIGFTYSIVCTASVLSFANHNIGATLLIGINIALCLLILRKVFFKTKNYYGSIYLAIGWIICVYYIIDPEFLKLLLYTSTSLLTFLALFLGFNNLQFRKFPLLSKMAILDEKVSNLLYPSTLFFRSLFFKCKSSSLAKYTVFFIENFSLKLNHYRILGKIKLYSVFQVLLLFSPFILSVFIAKSYSNPLSRRTIVGRIELPSGTGIGATDKISKKVEASILAANVSDEVLTTVESDHANLIIKLRKGESPDPELLAFLKKGIGKQAPAYVSLLPDRDNETSIETTYEIRGPDQIELDQLVKIFSKETSGMPEVEETVLRYKGPRDEFIMDLDPSKSSQSLLETSHLGEDIRLTLQGGVGAKAFVDSKLYDVRIRSTEEFRESKTSLNKIKVRNSASKFVPVEEITSGKEDTTPVKIYHTDRKRSLAFSVRLRNDSPAYIDKVRDRVNDIPLPGDYTIYTSEGESFAKRFDVAFILTLTVLILLPIVSYLGNPSLYNRFLMQSCKLSVLFIFLGIVFPEWRSDSYIYFILLGLLI